MYGAPTNHRRSPAGHVERQVPRRGNAFPRDLQRQGVHCIREASRLLKVYYTEHRARYAAG